MSQNSHTTVVAAAVEADSNYEQELVELDVVDDHTLVAQEYCSQTTCFLFLPVVAKLKYYKTHQKKIIYEPGISSHQALILTPELSARRCTYLEHCVAVLELAKALRSH